MTKCKVIALANQKGGTAKTTTTLNLGIGLAHQGRKVLLVDADPQGDLTTALGWTNADSLPVTLETQMKKILQDEPFVYNEGILHHEEGVDIIPTNIELSGMEISLVNAMSREQTLKLYLSDLKKDYDYILIDTCPSLGMLTINALAAADEVIITVNPQLLAMMGLQDYLRTVTKIRRRINPKLKVAGILMTMCEARTNLCRTLTEQVTESFQGQIRVFDTRIPHTVKVGESIYYSMPVEQYSPKASAGIAYGKFAEELISIEN